MAAPKELVDRLEQGAELPSGDEERFAGYGVMGVPFTSGDLLAMRRFPASSLGRGYTSVWHRDPRGRWAFYSDVPPQDRKSTRLNSSHANISYAVFCLKKKNNYQYNHT